MIPLLILSSLAHVPSYPGLYGIKCTDRCCKLPHDADTSQVLYLDERGGGYETTVPKVLLRFVCFSANIGINFFYFDTELRGNYHRRNI